MSAILGTLEPGVKLVGGGDGWVVGGWVGVKWVFYTIIMWRARPALP